MLSESIPEEVRSQLHDPNRLCPVLAGAARVRGATLTVRTRGQDIEVAAPPDLLEQVFALCDGTRSVNDVVADASPPQSAAMREFLGFLLESGAMVDASLWTLHASAAAHQGVLFGLCAPAAVTDGLCRRFRVSPGAATECMPIEAHAVPQAPLQDLFEARVSSHAFAARPLGQDTLLQFAWSIAGVVRAGRGRAGPPRRTLASAGGMHLLQVHLVLQHAVEGHAPGAYRVLYPGARSVALVRSDGHAADLPRAFVCPAHAEGATGAVFLCGDGETAALRYRNRATQYLFMEAGAALHNAALTAPQLGMAFSAMGGYYEPEVTALCGTGRQIILGCGLFGPAVTTSPSPP